MQIYRKIVVDPWKKWFAWRPVKIHNKKVWCRYVYRRQVFLYIDVDVVSKSEYGTIFDVMQSNP